MTIKKTLSREEVLGGMAGRVAKQASTVLVAIESRTAYLVAQSQQAMAQFLTEAAAKERSRAFLEAIALGREPPVPPTIQDLERYAPQWAPLLPDNPSVRAATAHWVGQKHRFTYRATPRLRAALGLELPAVQEAYQRLYNKPLASLYTPQIGLTDRLRWVWAGVGNWLENLPPFWTAFALVLTETVGAGILALPIALAKVGPLAGVVILLILGLVNVATIAAISETMARSGQVRYGQAYFGRLVNDYLGGVGSFILTLALFMLNSLFVSVYYIGFSLTLAAATAPLRGPPATVWAVVIFFIGLYFLSRKSLSSTVASALVIGAINIALILVLCGLALPYVHLANLAYVNLPFLNGRAFDASLLELIFGVVLLAYFGHTSTANCARVVLRRDPGARSLIQGCMAATATAMGLYCLWVLAVNGAIAPQRLAQESGTALTPLAQQVGPSVLVVGAIFASLGMGLASIHMNLGLFYLMQERLPARVRSLGERGRFWVTISPIVLIFLLTEWLLLTGRESFTGPLSFTGTITATLVGGIFPILLLVASRRKGEFVPSFVLPVLGHPLFVALLYILFLSSLMVHGLVIWQNPLERAVALIVTCLMIGATVVMVRRGRFKTRAVVEVRDDQRVGNQASFAITLKGQPASATTQLGYGQTTQQFQAMAGAIANFATLHSLTVDIPTPATQELKVWVHRITPEGDSVGLPGSISLQQNAAQATKQVPLVDGQVVLALTNAQSQVKITLVA